MYVYLDVTIVHCTTVAFKTITKSNSDCEVCIAGRPPSASFHRAHLSHNGGDIVMLRLAEIQISNSALSDSRHTMFLFFSIPYIISSGKENMYISSSFSKLIKHAVAVLHGYLCLSIENECPFLRKYMVSLKKCSLAISAPLGDLG